MQWTRSRRVQGHLPVIDVGRVVTDPENSSVFNDLANSSRGH